MDNEKQIVLFLKSGTTFNELQIAAKINERHPSLNSPMTIPYDENNPNVYQVVSELDTPMNSKTGGASFDDFCKSVNNRIPERESDAFKTFVVKYTSGFEPHAWTKLMKRYIKSQPTTQT